MSPSQFFENAIFWVEVDKIHPNPYQPRQEFDEARLNDLADSIRMYGVLQPLVVTRQEIIRADGGLSVEYELISGERRLRASKLAGIAQVPVIIRSSSDDARVKLELAIIENLQREDLNPVDRARAFQRLTEEFKYKHNQIAAKVGKSREYVSNTLRILTLPENILEALSTGKISEGHSRPLLMLVDRPEEQQTLFKEMLFKKLTVRETEGIARRIAYDRVRKKERAFDPAILEMEEKFTESLGTRVQIVKGDNGGKIQIDYFTPNDLRSIYELIKSNKERRQSNDFLNNPSALAEAVGEQNGNSSVSLEKQPSQSSQLVSQTSDAEAAKTPEEGSAASLAAPVDDRSKEDKQTAESELYAVKNFTV